MRLNPIIPAVPLLLGIGLILALTIYHGLSRSGFINKVLTIIRYTLICILAALIGLRVQIADESFKIQVKNTDVLFVVDSTLSMWASDYSGEPRMTGVKKDCKTIMTQLAGANFGLVKFANHSQILAPFTQDADAVDDAMALIDMPSEYYANGSSLNTPYEDMKKLLESSSKKEGRQTVVFFISDGEITNNSTLQSYSELSSMVDGGAVLGYGTAEGATIKGAYIYDYQNGGQAKPKIDEINLQHIANDLKIDYIHCEKKTSFISLTQKIIRNSGVTTTETNGVVYEDISWMFAIPLTLLLGWELVRVIRKDDL